MVAYHNHIKMLVDRKMQGIASSFFIFINSVKVDENIGIITFFGIFICMKMGLGHRAGRLSFNGEDGSKLRGMANVKKRPNC